MPSPKKKHIRKGVSIKSPAPALEKEMREFVITEIACGRRIVDVHKRVCSNVMPDTFGIEKLDPKVYPYANFRKLVRRIDPKLITEAYEKWKDNFQDVKWATEKARVSKLSEILEKFVKIFDAQGIKKIDPELMKQMRETMDAIRKERSAEPDRKALERSGSKIFLANPKHIELDLGYVNELVMIVKEEMGGLHNIGLEKFTVRELDQLIKSATDAKHEKINSIMEADSEVVTDEKE